jgi:hypothetical protein
VVAFIEQFGFGEEDYFDYLARVCGAAEEGR